MPTLRLLSPGTLPKIGHGMAFCAPSVTIGSRSPADLVLREPSVSPLHARLTQTAGGFLIEDLGSRGGIYVGPRRVSSAHVDYRQLFRVGRVAVMLLEDEATRHGACPAEVAEPTVPMAFREPATQQQPASGHALSRWVLGAALGATSLVVGALFIGRMWVARAPEASASTAATTSFLTLTPDSEAVRFELDPRLSFWVPSAAVSSTAVLSATLVERPREPTTPLLRAEGPGAWLDFASNDASIVGLLPLFASRANASAPPLWGHYLPRGRRWNFAPASTPLRLRDASLIVPLTPTAGAVLRTVGHFQFLYSGTSGIAAQQLEELKGKLEKTWQHFDSLGYPLPATPVLTLLGAETGSTRAPSCQSHLDFKLPLSNLSSKEMERALFAVVLRESVDCRHVGAAPSEFGTVTDILASNEGTPEICPTATPEPFVIGLFGKPRGAVDVTAQFVNWLVREPGMRAQLLGALAAELEESARGRAVHPEPPVRKMVRAFEQTAGLPLAQAWSQFVSDELPAQPFAVARMAECGPHGFVTWRSSASEFSAELRCDDSFGRQ